MTSVTEALAHLQRSPAFTRRQLVIPVPVPCAQCNGRGWLDPQHVCACANGQREYARELRALERAQREREDRMRKLLDRTLDFSEDEKGYKLDTFPHQDAEYFQLVVGFLRLWDWKRNLLLLGSVGTGKTGLMVSLLKALRKEAERDGNAMYYLSEFQLYARMRRTFNNEDMPLDTLLENYKRVPLLALDDVGKEKKTEWTAAKLFDIINARYRAGLPTWMTSNLTPRGFAEWLDPAVLSRLQQRGSLIECVGNDLRLTAAP